MSGRTPDLDWMPLKLGADTVQALLPHRRPFVFVDATVAIARSPRPALRARKLVSSNEPVFEGHFPGLALWPGIHTIEGLGQTANVLVVLLACLEGFAERGFGAEALFEALRNIDARARMKGRAATALETELLEKLGAPRRRIAYAGAIDVKLLEPVFAGATIDYEVVLTHVLANARRFDVEACVEERPVARGTITIALP